MAFSSSCTSILQPKSAGSRCRTVRGQVCLPRDERLRSALLGHLVLAILSAGEGLVEQTVEVGHREERVVKETSKRHRGCGYALSMRRYVVLWFSVVGVLPLLPSLYTALRQVSGVLRWKCRQNTLFFQRDSSTIRGPASRRGKRLEGGRTQLAPGSWFSTQDEAHQNKPEWRRTRTRLRG